MRKDLERRLRGLEMASSRRIEVWVEQRDGSLRGPDGERITRKAFFRLHPPESPDVLIISAVDGAL
jgi:hypothetical protein